MTDGELCEVGTFFVNGVNREDVHTKNVLTTTSMIKLASTGRDCFVPRQTCNAEAR